MIVTAFGETEEQLLRALESLRPNISLLTEIIVVDDGVKNFDTAKFDGYKVEDLKVQVIKQPNSGLSVARNAGLRRATGEYVAFLDADDEWGKPDLSRLLDDRIDVIRMGLEEMDQSGIVTTHIDAFDVLDGVSYLNQRVSSDTLHPSSCAYVYRRGWMLKNGIQFHPGLLHEDLLFAIQALSSATTVAGVVGIGYRYHRRPASITSSATATHLTRRVKSLRRIHRQLVRLRQSMPALRLDPWLSKIRRYASYISRRSPSRCVKVQSLALYFQIFRTGYFIDIRSEWSFLANSALRECMEFVAGSVLKEKLDR